MLKWILGGLALLLLLASAFLWMLRPGAQRLEGGAAPDFTLPDQDGKRVELGDLALTAEGARIRLCKGAYNEPPDKAFPRKADVDANYVKLTQVLFDRAQTVPPAGGSGRTPPLPAIATHDEKTITAAKAYAKEKRLPREYFEFQMLYGIRRALQEALLPGGYALRVYVPSGTSWYPYFMRRLAERPANVWFILSNLFRR